MNTISYGSVTVIPTQIDGWSDAFESGNLLHPLIAGDVEVTHAPHGPRRFTLRLVFPVEADAMGCVQLHHAAPFLDLESDERVIPNCRYVLDENGGVRVELDDVTRDVWVVFVDAVEVSS